MNYDPEILKLDKLRDHVRATNDVFTAAAISVAIDKLREPDTSELVEKLAMLNEWQVALDFENQQLVDEGEEPLTIAEFVSCKAQDASFERTQAERLRVARWHDTYNASLTGCRAHSPADSTIYTVAGARIQASEDANALHGLLVPEPKP